MPQIYLDNSSFACTSPHVVSQMSAYFSTHWGCPLMPHRHAQRLLKEMQSLYDQLYNLLDISYEDTFILTSSGAEAVNQLFEIVYRKCLLTQEKSEQKKSELLTTALEEAPTLMCISRLEQINGSNPIKGIMVDPDHTGSISAQSIKQQLTSRCALVSLSHGNGMLGTLCEAQAIAELCREKGALFHLDITHSLGKVDLRLSDLQADFITFSAEPLHLPVGIGALIIKNGAPSCPLIVGGLEQGSLRAGTFNLPGLGALCCGIKELLESQDYLCTETARLRNRLIEQVCLRLPQARPLLQDSSNLPHIGLIAFANINNEALLYQLDSRGLAASIGGGHFQQLSLLLESCHVDPQLAQSAISFALSRYTEQEEVDLAVDIIVDAVKQLNKTALPEQELIRWG